MRMTVLLILFATFIQFGCTAGDQSKSAVDPDKQKAYANELLNKQLYQQAIAAFEVYLQAPDLDDKIRANINYIIATTYLERLNDYENAMAYFLKIKNFYPESELEKQVNKGIVTCLERLERSADAQQALSEVTTLNPDEARKSLPGQVVAEIGDRQITQGDLDAEINNLPPPMRQEYQAADKKVQFLQQMLATDLMYEKAKRAGYENNPDIVNQIFEARKSILVQNLIEDEIRDQIKVTDFDVKLYYDANAERYITTDEDGNERQLELTEIKERVRADLKREREQQAYQELVQRLLTANDVKLYSDLVK